MLQKHSISTGVKCDERSEEARGHRKGRLVATRFRCGKRVDDTESVKRVNCVGAGRVAKHTKCGKMYRHSVRCVQCAYNTALPSKRTAYTDHLSSIRLGALWSGCYSTFGRRTLRSVD